MCSRFDVRSRPVRNTTSSLSAAAIYLFYFIISKKERKKMEERNEMKWGWRWGSRMGTEAGVCEHCGFPLHVTHFPHVRNLVFPFLLFFLPLFFLKKKKLKRVA
jgi:hypothetical protein